MADLKEELGAENITNAQARTERRRQLMRHAAAGAVEYRIFGEVLSRDEAVLDALLDAPQLDVIQLTRPRAAAIAGLEARGHESDGKGVAGVSAECVHDKYAAQVIQIKSKVEARAAERGIELRAEYWRALPSGEVAETEVERVIAEAL